MIKVKGCYFFFQAIWRKIKIFEYTAVYKNNRDFRWLIRKTFSLDFCDLPDIYNIYI